jgi:hypothetical protein
MYYTYRGEMCKSLLCYQLGILMDFINQACSTIGQGGQKPSLVSRCSTFFGNKFTYLISMSQLYACCPHSGYVDLEIFAT